MTVVVRKKHIRNAIIVGTFLFVMLFVGMYLSINAIQADQRNKLVAVQKASCERGNVLRSQQGSSNLVVKSTLSDLSVWIKLSSDKHKRLGEFELASNGYRVAQNLQDFASSIKPLPLRDCNQEYGELD
jgi:hypothetical protein